MKRLVVTALLLFLMVPAAYGAPKQPPAKKIGKKPVFSEFRGWDYLVERLRRDGVPQATLESIYQNPLMPPFHRVTFSLRPRESVSLYRHTYAESRLQLARNFLVRNEMQLQRAEHTFRVSRYVVTAILLVETHFGKNTGRELVINRISRVAGIGEPNNLLFNYHRLLNDDPTVTYGKVEARARYLEDMFYPELAAFFEVIARKRVKPLELRGSIAGAFGLPQFLPSSYLKFGFDGDRDGFVSLFEPVDAIYSTANFLSSFGWRDEASYEEKRQVIWKYNHSDAYVDTILEIARRLAEQPLVAKPALPISPKKKKTPKMAAKHKHSKVVKTK